MQKERDTFLRHAECPRCGSSDGVAVHKSGFSFCHVCRKDVTQMMDEGAQAPSSVSKPKASIDLEFIPIEYKPIAKRGIGQKICQRYSYGYSTNCKGQRVHVANYETSGYIVAQHLRTADKKFSWIGDTSSLELFGQHLFKGHGKRIYVVEGEIDCLTVAQVLEKWPVVSVPNGAQSAANYIKQNLEFLESYEEIVLCFDNDQPDRLGRRAGQEATQICAALFTPGKARVVKLPLKDPNAMLMAGRTAELIKALMEAKIYRPDGVISMRDIPLAQLKETPNFQAFHSPFPELDTMLRKFRKGELTVVTAGSGMGKTTFVKELAACLRSQGAKVGVASLEESKEKTTISFIAMQYDVPFGDVFLDRSLLTDEQWEQGYDSITNDSGMYLYDHFGSLDSDNLISKLRFLATGCGCDFIILDHISIVVSGIEEGDERRIIDNLMTHLRALVENTGVGMIAVSHLRVPEKGKPHEEGGRVYMNQLRGSGAIKQLSDNIIAIEGNQQGKQLNRRLIRLLKNRLFGTVGIADTLDYSPTTGRLKATDELYESEEF